MTRTKLKSTRFKPVKTDIHEFQTLYRLMYAIFGSQKKAAQALQISYPTYLKWETNPPQWPYYNLIMEHLIKIKLRSLITRRNKFTSKQERHIKEELYKLSNSRQILLELEEQMLELHGAEDHLRTLLSRKGMYWDDIRKQTNTGGYSPRTLQRAATKMGIIKDRRGFGDKQKSYWRLPTLANDQLYEDDD